MRPARLFGLALFDQLIELERLLEPLSLERLAELGTQVGGCAVSFSHLFGGEKLPEQISWNDHGGIREDTDSRAMSIRNSLLARAAEQTFKRSSSPVRAQDVSEHAEG